MRILQLGNNNWANQYSLSEDLEWHFNDFPEKLKVKDKKAKGYLVVIIDEGAKLSDENWKKLYLLIDPYHVLYTEKALENLSATGENFLKCTAAEKIVEDPQTLINHLQVRYFFGQSGIRIFPTAIELNSKKINEFEFLDSGNLKLQIDSQKKWINIGAYRNGLYLDPNRKIKLWLTMKAKNVSVRLRVFIQEIGSDGNPDNNYVLLIDKNSDKELYLPISVSKTPRVADITIEVKGFGELTIGVLHSRWGRDGKGEFIAGGKRIVNLERREDIAYYFNPGDLKPPLNVYFAGARSLEGFEAFPLFRKLKAPALLFTDMRLSIGQFYDDKDNVMGTKIEDVIMRTLKKLGFDKSQLIMNGISMGTYPALKYGSRIGAYMINVAKPLGNLGYIASRARLQRPDDFDTIFDIDHQLISTLDDKNLHKLDEKFWQEFDHSDLSKTRLFVGYMENDDYDDIAINKLKASPAVKTAKQFSFKGFPGRHNDNDAINAWFVERLVYVLQNNFNRKK